MRLPFASSHKVASRPFELLHCDVWTSPVISNSGYKYYLVILDDHTHFAWTFPLQIKSDVLPTLICFHAYVRTQFRSSIASLQTDNGKEFDNHALRSFLASNGMILRLTCPYTSQQNGHAERRAHSSHPQRQHSRPSLPRRRAHDVLARGSRHGHLHAQPSSMPPTQRCYTVPACWRSLSTLFIPCLSLIMA